MGTAAGESDMTDRELLEDCLTAFAAIPTAPKSRAVLKKWGITHGAYAGNGSHLLAEYMAKKLREYLNGGAS